MRLVDANVLLYAVNEDAQHHTASRAWLDAALGGGDAVGFSWIVGVAFLRLSTSAAVFPTPLAIDEAVGQLHDWTSGGTASWVEPSAGHLTHLERVLQGLGTGGNLVNDAHLAALAVEHRAAIVSYDNDFARFEGVRWTTPDRLLSV